MLLLEKRLVAVKKDDLTKKEQHGGRSAGVLVRSKHGKSPAFRILCDCGRRDVAADEDARTPGCFLIFARAGFVEGDGGEDDETFYNLLPEGGHFEENEAVIENADDEAAEDRSQDRAPAAAQGGATNHNCGNGIKFVAKTRAGRGRVQPCCEDQTSYSRSQAGERIDGDFDATNVEAA